MADVPAVVEPTEIARPIAYYYRDNNTGEKYPVFEARGTAWWMDSGVKLHQLLLSFKRGEMVREACESTAITYEQYRDFRLLHPWLPQLIRTYKHIIPNRLKGVILRAALGTPEERDPNTGAIIKPATEPNAKIALGAYRIFAPEEDDPDFTRQPEPLIVPPGGSQETLINERILDADGKVLISRQTAELLKNHGDNPN